MSAIRELNATESGEDSTSRAARETLVGVSRLPFLGPIATTRLVSPLATGVTVKVLELGKSSDRKSNHMDQAKPQFFLQSPDNVEIRIGEMNRSGFQLAGFGHGRWT